MHKKPVALAILASLGLGAGLAAAGAHDQFGFYISPAGQGSRYTYGTFSDVRNSADPTAYAECGSNATSGFCTFVQNGVYLSCYTTDPAKIDVIRNMTDGAYFSASWTEATAECTYVLQYSSSRAAPKAP